MLKALPLPDDLGQDLNAPSSPLASSGNHLLSLSMFASSDSILVATDFPTTNTVAGQSTEQITKKPSQLSHRRQQKTTQDAAATTQEYMDDARIEEYGALTPPDLLARVLPLTDDHKRY